MIATGASATRTVAVDDRRAIGFMGPDLRVYSTPAMIEDMEMACRDLLLEMLEPGQDSVGARVGVAHVGSAPLGGRVDITVAVVAVEGRRVTFEVAAATGGQPVGHGRHERAVVSLERLRARLAAR